RRHPILRRDCQSHRRRGRRRHARLAARRVDESPGEIIIFQGEHFKEYRGMGSLGAMHERRVSRARYAQEGVYKTVPEGIEGRVPYKGRLADLVYQLVGGLKAGMKYVGGRTIAEMPSQAQLL